MNAERPQMNAVTPLQWIKGSLSRVIGAAYKVSNTLGIGFLEKVYENALALELRSQQLVVEQQRGVLVRYEGEVVGEYVPDLLVEDILIVEVKSVTSLERAHRL